MFYFIYFIILLNYLIFENMVAYSKEGSVIMYDVSCQAWALCGDREEEARTVVISHLFKLLFSLFIRCGSS